MAFDAEGIQDFIKRGEKSQPPVFVGRKNVLDDIETVGGLMSNNRTSGMHGVPGMTRIIQGAPGAGKSSVLAELAKRSVGRSDALRQSRVVIFESSEILESLPDVIGAIAVAASLTRTEWRKYVPQTLGMAGFSVGTPQALRHTEPQNLSGLARMYSREKWAASVIVAIDEAQRLPRDDAAPHALFLQGIHSAVRKLPLSLVLAGLGGTKDTVIDMGLTRGLKIHEVGGLEAAAVSGLMRDFCRRFGMDPSGYEAYLEALAKPAEGWPRHLHFAMQALGREALRRGGDLDRADWTRIGNEAAESRIRYYSGQQSVEMAESAGLTAAVMRGLAPGMMRMDVLGLIEDNVRGKVGCRLPEGMDSSRFLRHLVHRGALQVCADHSIHCPIPSFRTYLTEAGGMTARLRPSGTPAPSSSGDGTESFGM